MECISNLPDYDRPRVFKLLFCKDAFLITAVSAIWTMARGRTFDTGAGRDLRIAEACLDRTFSSDISLGIGFDSNANLITEPSQVIHASQAQACYPPNFLNTPSN
jgi:hypothetical protein